jgi:hypothetical protein
MPPPDAAEGEGGADDDGETDFGGEVEAVAQVVDERGSRNVKADAGHRILEEEAVFGFLDGFELGADQLDVVAVEDAGVGEFDGEVERGLAADCGQEGEDAVAALVAQHLRFEAEDLVEIFLRERLDVSAVGELGSVMMVAGFELTSTTS